MAKGKDYKLTNDAVNVADVGFKKQLWTLDKELDVVWDWGSENWEVWKFPGQGGKKVKVVDSKAHYVMRVQTQDRSFRELGADILLNLQKGDTTKYSLEQLVSYFDTMDDNIQRAKAKGFRDWVQSVALDTYDYARGVKKSVVPGKVKASDVKYLIEVPGRKKEMGLKIFKPRTTTKLARVISEVG